MFLWRKALGVTAICALCILLGTVSLFAGWWDVGDISAPQGATQIKKETRNIAGSEFEFTYYESTQSSERIKDFYRRQLAGSGWKELDPYKDLASDIEVPEGMPKVDTGYLDKIIKTNLMFQNDDQMLSISFLPEGYARGGKTHFTLSKGSKPQGGVDTSKMQVPELLAQPKKDVYPVYPGSSLVNLSEDKHYLRATYFTRDDIEDAVTFYRREMSRYNWSLNDEKPISKMNKVDSAGGLGKYDCPSCASPLDLSGMSLELWSAYLEFTNGRGDICRLTMAQSVPPQGEQYGSLAMTTISVDYVEKTD